MADMWHVIVIETLHCIINSASKYIYIYTYSHRWKRDYFRGRDRGHKTESLMQYWLQARKQTKRGNIGTCSRTQSGVTWPRQTGMSVFVTCGITQNLTLSQEWIIGQTCSVSITKCGYWRATLWKKGLNHKHIHYRYTHIYIYMCVCVYCGWIIHGYYVTSCTQARTVTSWPIKHAHTWTTLMLIRVYQWGAADWGTADENWPHSNI